MHIYTEKKSFFHKENVWQGQGLPGPVFTFDHVGSVLDEAWALVAEDIFPIWASALALSQNQGRGQTRRLWHSPVGNVYAALRLPLEGPFLTTAAAPALSVFLVQALQSIEYFLRIKWPNDLVLQGASADTALKVGGILLEERQGVLMAGIGLNVVEAPSTNILRENHALSAGCLGAFDMKKSCVRLENNSSFSHENPAAECLWLHLVSGLYFWYKKKLPTDMSWKDDAEQLLLWKGQYIELDDGHEKIRGILQGLGNLGEIRIERQGQLQLYTSGSLRLVQEGER